MRRARTDGTPVMVVKYDNTPAAQPHRGLTSADIVYVEPDSGSCFRRRLLRDRTGFQNSLEAVPLWLFVFGRSSLRIHFVEVR